MRRDPQTNNPAERKPEQKTKSPARRRPRSVRRGGFTLIELTVTMALVAVITTIAVGIVALISKTAGYSENALVRTTELRRARNEITLWASSFDSAECVFDVAANQLTAIKGTGAKTCGITDGVMRLQPRDGDETDETEFTVITEAVFALLPKYEGVVSTGGLVSCTLKYDGGDSDYTFVFYIRCAECTGDTPAPEESAPSDTSSGDTSSGDTSSEESVPVSVSGESSPDGVAESGYGESSEEVSV